MLGISFDFEGENKTGISGLLLDMIKTNLPHTPSYTLPNRKHWTCQGQDKDVLKDQSKELSLDNYTRNTRVEKEK